LVGKIDEGAESVVYEGREKKSDKKYAVKVFKKKDQDFINRIKTQFRILKNLNHPNIIKAYNLFVN
jgi:serine/threonine protein kinase